MIDTRYVFIYFFHLSSQYLDNINVEDKVIITKLAHELVADAKLKISQVDGVRTEHAYFIPFEVGYVIGQIREKYRLMMELYRIAFNRINQLAQLPPPRTASYRSIHYFMKMEYIHLLEMDIDKLVQVLENMPEHQGPHMMRAGHRDSEEEQKYSQLEEEVKKRYREEHLMRKLHSPGRRTARKRFIDKWPVQATWSLERY